MLFQDLALLFEELIAVSSRNEIIRLLGECFKKASAHEARLIAYMALGDIGPVYQGLRFNVGEKGMIKAVATLCGRTADEVVQRVQELGDLGSVVEKMYVQGAGQISFLTPAVTLEAIHKFLVDFQALEGTGAQDKREKLFIQAAAPLDGVSLKFLVRIILGKLRLGFSDMSLLDAFSYTITGDKTLRKNLEHAYNVCVDLGVIIERLKLHGSTGVDDISIIPGIPIRPAGAERLESAQAIIDKLGTCVAQPKLDGFRVQIHFFKDDAGKSHVNFFSRNLQDMSDMFPELKNIVMSLPVKNCIFEGEAISFNPDTGDFLPFQETVKRKRKYEVAETAEEFPLKLFAFDLLFVDGVSCLALTHAERRAKMCTMIAYEGLAARDVLLPIDEKMMTTATDLEDYFHALIGQGLEGLVVKRPDALYAAGKRNFNWIKLKRQETGSLDDTLDCVVVGYYHGSGKRAKFGIGALLVAVYDHEQDLFQTVAKIGTGLTDEEWISMRAACDAVKADHKPVSVECAKELFPDVWVNPEIVCLVRADEITYSPSHGAARRVMSKGLALRFPRFMGLRPDKRACDATNVEELARLFSLQKVKRD